MRLTCPLQNISVTGSCRECVSFLILINQDTDTDTGQIKQTVYLAKIEKYTTLCFIKQKVNKRIFEKMCKYIILTYYLKVIIIFVL